jgi:hypothetical protein
MPRLATAFLALLCAGLFWAFGQCAADSATQPTIASGAVLEVYPAPPYVRTTYRVDLGSTRHTATEQAWVYEVNRNTNRITAVRGFAQLRLDNTCCRVDTVGSYPVYVTPGVCLIPAGHVLDSSGRPYASTIGPRYCW